MLYEYNESTCLAGHCQAQPGCNGFWDPTKARISDCYSTFISAVPIVIAICILLSHVLRLMVVYRPRWSKPFIEESKLLRNGTKAEYNVSLFGLALFSLCGFMLQAMRLVLDVQLGTFFPALAWAVAGLLVLTLQLRTTSPSLFLLYASIAFSRLDVVVNVRPPWSGEDVAVILQILMALCSMTVLLRMPMRDPRISSTLIAPTFTSPTSEFRTPEDNLTLWQFLTVSWMSPLISLGTKRQLNDEDVWSLGYEFQHRPLHENFRQLRGSAIRRLIKANVIDILILCTLGVLDVLAAFSVPVLLQQLLRAMDDQTAPQNAAYTYAALSCFVRLVSSQSGVLSLWFGRRCYERSRGEMITMLYGKILSRKIVGLGLDPHQKQALTSDPAGDPNNEASSGPSKRTWYDVIIKPLRKKSDRTEARPRIVEKKANEAASTGKILNLMRNDVYEVAQRFWEVQSLVTKPLGFVVSLVLIWRLIGWPCLLGIVTVLVAQLINAAFARVLLGWERLRRSATDGRLQHVSQFVEAIRHLRWYGWEDAWCAQIMKARQDELNLRIVTAGWNILIGFTNTFASGMFPVAAFYAYSSLAGLPLRIDIAFPALQLFTMLENNLRDLPNLITVLLNARVAAGRIEEFMSEPDRDDAYDKDRLTGDIHSNGDLQHSNGDLQRNQHQQMVLDHASFAWPGSSLVLRDISLSFPQGLTVIFGEVASGKTALLQALLGELDLVEGELKRPKEAMGYCAQSPWLQSMSIRENILFSEPYEEARYQETLDICALIPDMANFKHGDLSNIGENGIGLSGGQKARVALARAVYSRARILLLDDPISALDHQTAELVVQRCLKGRLMKDRTVILVTHRTELCVGLAEQFVRISAGRANIAETGEANQNSLPPASSSTAPPKKGDDDALAPAPDKFIEDEHRAHGDVQVTVYWEYIKAGKLKWWFLFVVLVALFRLVTVGQTWFLKQWGEAYDQAVYLVSDVVLQREMVSVAGLFDSFPSPETDIRPWLVGFTVLAIVKAVMFLMGQCLMVVIVYCAGKQMFKEIMYRVTGATFRFYDVTPVGRLMNRLTSDIGTIDGNISMQFQAVSGLSITWLVSIVVIASVTPLFLIFALALTFAFVLIFLRFLPTSQSLRRLEMVSLTPLISNFGTLLNGLMTVRAFHVQSRFQDRVIAVTDTFQKMDHFYWSLQAWLMYRFDNLSACSTFLLTVLAIFTNISPGLTAFVLYSASQFVDSTHALCKVYGQLQMDFVSVERVVELLHLQQEQSDQTKAPPAWWPRLSGDVVFEDATIRYAPHLDPSLRNLSFRISSGSKTAIVGRTGSGKSTLAMALLATVLPESGSIYIDSLDISKFDAKPLRRRFTFLAQDPILFPGSMHQNLDPLEEHSEDECETVLQKICGKHRWTLSTQIDTGGRNLSQGQRQLIGLARTLLRRSSIIILDEATASIDMETAMTVQQILNDEMKDSTIITIAHRLEAVKNADYCIVLDMGRIVRQGTAMDILKETVSAS